MRASLAILFFSLLIVKNLAAQEMVYQPGEKVEYLIQYGFINGGLATLELKKDTCCGLNTTYHTRPRERQPGGRSIFSGQAFTMVYGILIQLPIKLSSISEEGSKI